MIPMDTFVQEHKEVIQKLFKPFSVDVEIQAIEDNHLIISWEYEHITDVSISIVHDEILGIHRFMVDSTKHYWFFQIELDEFHSITAAIINMLIHANQADDNHYIFFKFYIYHELIEKINKYLNYSYYQGKTSFPNKKKDFLFAILEQHYVSANTTNYSPEELLSAQQLHMVDYAKSDINASTSNKNKLRGRNINRKYGDVGRHFNGYRWCVNNEKVLKELDKKWSMNKKVFDFLLEHTHISFYGGKRWFVEEYIIKGDFNLAQFWFANILIQYVIDWQENKIVLICYEKNKYLQGIVDLSSYTRIKEMIDNTKQENQLEMALSGIEVNFIQDSYFDKRVSIEIIDFFINHLLKVYNYDYDKVFNLFQPEVNSGKLHRLKANESSIVANKKGANIMTHYFSFKKGPYIYLYMVSYFDDKSIIAEAFIKEESSEEVNRKINEFSNQLEAKIHEPFSLMSFEEHWNT